MQKKYKIFGGEREADGTKPPVFFPFGVHASPDV